MRQRRPGVMVVCQDQAQMESTAFVLRTVGFCPIKTSVVRTADATAAAVDASPVEECRDGIKAVLVVGKVRGMQGKLERLRKKIGPVPVVMFGKGCEAGSAVVQVFVSPEDGVAGVVDALWRVTARRRKGGQEKVYA